MLLAVLSLVTVSFAQQPLSPLATEWRLYEPQFYFESGELYLRGAVSVGAQDVNRLQEIAVEIACIDAQLQDLHRQQLW
ncbi:MAG: hypothetical protein K9M03_04320 [Kiritimatiellales bacterium]|nr:hypothetical protein [Kiritimatiellales bacterium]